MSQADKNACVEKINTNQQIKKYLIVKDIGSSISPTFDIICLTL
jgi:hypothetical protein